MNPLWVLIGVPLGMVILSFFCGLMAALGWRAGGRHLPRPAATALSPGRIVWANLPPRPSARGDGPADTPTEELRPYTWRPPHVPWPREGTD